MKGLIIKCVLLLVVIVVGYNYFLGNDEERKSSERIFGQVKELTGSVAGLLASEKEKFDQGKYDDAIGKLKSALATMHEKAVEMGQQGQEWLQELEILEKQEESLESELHKLENSPESADTEDQAEAIRMRILELNQRTRQLSSTLQRELE